MKTKTPLDLINDAVLRLNLCLQFTETAQKNLSTTRAADELMETLIILHTAIPRAILEIREATTMIADIIATRPPEI